LGIGPHSSCLYFLLVLQPATLVNKFHFGASMLVLPRFLAPES